MKHLNSEELLTHARKLADEERRITTSLIECLSEINKRRLYVEQGYTSMWQFVTQYLKLSEGAAQRRLDAMRLLNDAPEAKDGLLDGSLSLSNASKLQSFRRAQKKLGKKSDASQLIGKTSGLSQRDCENILRGIEPQAMPQESDRSVSNEGEHAIKTVVSKELYEKLQYLKGLLAHALPDATYAELIERMADETIRILEKEKGISLDPTTAAAAAIKHEKQNPLPKGIRVHIPAVIERAVWARGKGRCEVLHQGQRCKSKHRIELDHITALVRGGSNEYKNLRLACWACNQHLALKKAVA